MDDLVQNSYMNLRTRDSTAPFDHAKDRTKCPNCGKMVTPNIVTRAENVGSEPNGKTGCCPCCRKKGTGSTQVLRKPSSGQNNREIDEELETILDIPHHEDTVSPGETRKSGTDVKNLVQLCPKCKFEIAEVLY